MTSTTTRTTGTAGMSTAWAIAAQVSDPELGGLTIAELGALRDVTEDDQGRVHVQIAPTCSGWSALEAIRLDLIEALTCAGYLHVDVEFVLSPGWSPDAVTDAGRRKLRDTGRSLTAPTDILARA